MKIKIFKHAALTMLIAAVTAVSAFAQQTIVAIPETTTTAYTYAQSDLIDGQVYTITGQQDTTYQKQMRKLRQQMQDLQKQMNSLRTDEYRKTAEQYRKSAEKLREKYRKMDGMTYTYSDSVSGLSKGLGVLVSPKMNFTYKDNSKSFHFNDYGDDYIKKKLQSGEVKEKVKNYTKSYNVDRDDKIQIDNKFGKITVNTWNKNEVKVEVQIKADADDDEAAQKLLDQVSVSDSKDASTVAFKTTINQDESSNWGTFNINGKSHVRQIVVNYNVYMPAKSALTLSNRFGSVKLPDLDGKVILNLSNGNLNAQQLNNPLNNLTIRFGDANIQSINCENLNMSYGKLNVGVADNLRGKMNFATVSVDRLKTAADVSIRYGDGFKVGQFDKGLKSVNLDATFTKVYLNVKDDYNFDVSTKSGNFNYQGVPVSLISQGPEDSHGYTSTKVYKGKIGKGSADKNINIKSRYTQVTFDQ